MNSTQFSSFLNGICKESLFVLDKAIPLSEYTSIDLSNNSELLSFDITSSQAWEYFIKSVSESGRYNAPAKSTLPPSVAVVCTDRR